MFHTYVATRSGKSVDIDRASFLMNKQLFQQALNIAMDGGSELSSRERSPVPQVVWPKLNS